MAVLRVERFVELKWMERGAGPNENGIVFFEVFGLAKMSGMGNGLTKNRGFGVFHFFQKG